MSEITVIHAYSDKITVKAEPSVYCPKGTVYIPVGQNTLLRHLKSLYEAEKQMNEYIRKYENALNGLKYWKDKALTKEESK